jgi:hypothetical protein
MTASHLPPVACQWFPRLASALDRRSHNPILREAALGGDSFPIAWLGQRKIEFTFR